MSTTEARMHVSLLSSSSGSMGCSGGASPLFVAGQSQVISRIRKGSQHIDIHEQRFTGSDVSNAFYCIKDFNVQNMLNSNQKLHCCQTYKRLLTHAIKLILSHRSNEVESEHVLRKIHHCTFRSQKLDSHFWTTFFTKNFYLSIQISDWPFCQCTNSLSLLHISSHHCTFCASLHAKTSPELNNY